MFTINTPGVGPAATLVILSPQSTAVTWKRLHVNPHSHCVSKDIGNVVFLGNLYAEKLMRD